MRPIGLISLIPILVLALSPYGYAETGDNGGQNKELLDCLCRCLEPPGGQFGCIYDEKDKGFSPSCANLENGPCICKAGGCFRGLLPTEGKCYEKCHKNYGKEESGTRPIDVQVPEDTPELQPETGQPDIIGPPLAPEPEDEPTGVMPNEKSKGILQKLIEETKDEKSKILLTKILSNLMDVEGLKDNIKDGLDASANTLYGIELKGESPSAEDVWDLVQLSNVAEIKKWFENGQYNTAQDLVWKSKKLSSESKGEIDTAINDLKKGEQRIIPLKFWSKSNWRETKVLVAKGPDASVTYTLDGKNYFDGRDIDTKLDPGRLDKLGSIKDEIGYWLSRSYRKESNIDYLARNVLIEHNENVELKNQRSEQLKNEVIEKAYQSIKDKMADFIKSGYAVSEENAFARTAKAASLIPAFLGFCIKEYYIEATNGAFSAVAQSYISKREAGHSQDVIMTDPFFDTSQESKSSNARTFDFMGPNPPKEKLQIFYDQLEKVYQRSKITKEDF